MGFEGEGTSSPNCMQIAVGLCFLGERIPKLHRIEKASVTRTTELYLPSHWVVRQIEAHSSHSFAHSPSIFPT